MDGTSILLSAGAGWLAGMRSLSAPTAAAFRLGRGLPPRSGVARALAAPAARWALPALALGELAADKRPGAGDRTAAPSLAFRAASGALTAAAIAPSRLRRGRSREALFAAAIGGAFAVLSSYANLWLRRRASRRTGASEQALGYAEDALAAGLGTALAIA
jgi:uncharacterized membrane protein